MPISIRVLSKLSLHSEIGVCVSSHHCWEKFKLVSQANTSVLDIDMVMRRAEQNADMSPANVSEGVQPESRQGAKKLNLHYSVK